MLLESIIISYDIVDNIYGDLILIERQGRQLVPAQSAYYEMIDLRFDLYDVLEILERGYDCERSKRAKGTIERCLRMKGETLLGE